METLALPLAELPTGQSALVGIIAMTFAILVAGVALGPWERPFHLRTLNALDDRFGRRPARTILAAIAAILAALAVAILMDLRPSYATSVQSGRLTWPSDSNRRSPGP